MATVTIILRDEQDSDWQDMHEDCDAISVEVSWGERGEIGEDPTLAQRGAMAALNMLMGPAEHVIGWEGMTREELGPDAIPSVIYHRDADDDGQER